MNPAQYHAVLLDLDRALYSFEVARPEVSREDLHLVQHLQQLRAQVLRAEAGLPPRPGPEAPPPAGPDITVAPW